jgi:hypothetical protein
MVNIWTAANANGWLEWSGRLPWSLLVGTRVARVAKLLPNRLLGDHRCGFVGFFVEYIESFTVTSSQFLDSPSLRNKTNEQLINTTERGRDGERERERAFSPE